MAIAVAMKTKSILNWILTILFSNVFKGNGYKLNLHIMCHCLGAMLFGSYPFSM